LYVFFSASECKKKTEAKHIEFETEINRTVYIHTYSSE